MTKPSDNPPSSASDDRALGLPLWVYSDRVPRAVRITGSICRMWAYFALFAALAHIVRLDASSGADPRDPIVVLRLGGTAAVCLLASMPRRHIAWYIGRWLLPVFYIAMLLRAQWLILLPMLVLLFPYLRNLTRTGVRAWYQPASTIDAALDRTAPSSRGVKS